MGILTEIRAGSLAVQAARRTRVDDEFSSQQVAWVPRGHLGGVAMTPDEALRLSAVWACVTVTSKALASCNWDVFLQRDNGDRESRHRVNAYSLLNMRPNPETTAFSFKEAMYIQAMIWGNFFAEIETDRGGRPLALWPLAPERCTLERDEDDRLVLSVRNRGGGEAVLDYDDVFHLHGPGLDALSGLEVVTLAARSLAHAAAAERFGQSFYHNNTQLGGLLSLQGKVGPEASKALTESIEEGRKGASNAWRLLVMDHGAKYDKFGVDPEQAQFIETRYLLIEEVCRWFGVPPHKIAHLLRSTFSNIEHQSIEFVRDALTPWAERSRQEADWKLLRPWPGIRTRIDLEWLAEGDAKTKAEVDSIEVQNGLVTRNEARRRRGRNSVGPDGDKLTIQVNMTTLDKVGMEPDEPQDPTGVAMTALFTNALHKAFTRRGRVAAEISSTAADEEAFRGRLEHDQAEHARYVGHLVADSLKAVHVDTDQPAVRDAIEALLLEDVGLACDAFARGDIAAWCDPAARARDVARRLSRIVER